MTLFVTLPDGNRKIVDIFEPGAFAEIETINGWYTADNNWEWFVYDGITYYAKTDTAYVSCKTDERLYSREACERHFALKAFW